MFSSVNFLLNVFKIKTLSLNVFHFDRIYFLDSLPNCFSFYCVETVGITQGSIRINIKFLFDGKRLAICNKLNWTYYSLLSTKNLWCNVMERIEK